MSTNSDSLSWSSITTNPMNVIMVSTLLILLFAYYYDDDDELVRTRKNAVMRRRLDWQFHGSTLLQESQFRRYYRMHASSFEKLLRSIAPRIVCKFPHKSISRTGIEPVTPANKLQMTLS